MRARWLVLVLLAPLAAHAAPRDELDSANASINDSRRRQEKLLREEKKAEEALADLKEKLVKAAADLQKSDAGLMEAEKKIAQTEEDLRAKEREAESARHKMDGLSRVAIRLSRTPPQAMVLMPADGKGRIQAAHALSLVTSEMKAQAQMIAEQMEALRQLKLRREEEKTAAETLKSSMEQKKKKIEAALKERRKLRDKIAASRQREDATIAALAKKAVSLQDLVAALEAEAERPRGGAGAGREVESSGAVAGLPGKLRDFESAKGRIRPPVSGRVVSGFGARSRSGEASKGISISARGGTTVVAPFDAEVAYTGSFLNYGRLVILKHRASNGGNYHTLLAGLARIDVRPGDFLLEGEPIGAMAGRNNPELYVELRENNQPVNPKPWMRGL